MRSIAVTLIICLLGIAVALPAQDVANVTKQSPFEIYGSASAGVGYYQSQGFSTSRKPYSYTIAAAPEISVYGIKIPLNFTLTEGSTSVTNPFAQFGINPYWKWIKLYAAWTNMKWSSTSLNGKTFLGIGVDINPSYFRFGALYGRFNPAIKENLLGNVPQDPVYKRRGWGLKLGVGKEDNYFDLIFLHVKDISNSIPPITDTISRFNFTPAENALFGIMSHESFLKKKLVWDLDGTVSAYTRNTYSELLDIGNGTGSKLLTKLIPPRLSTSYAWAAHSNLAYRAQNFSLIFDYSRYQPEYQSMGLDYVQNDQEKYLLNQTFLAAGKKLNVAFMEFFQRDDLNGRKSVKTDRAGINTSFAYNLNQHFGFNVGYNNFSLFQQKGLRDLNDTTKLSQVQNTFVIAPRYTFISPKLIQNILLIGTYTRLDDLNNFTAKYTSNSTVNSTVGYTATILKAFLTVAPSFTVLYSKAASFELLSISPSLSISKTWYKGKISTSTIFTFTDSRNNAIWNTKTFNNNISIGYRIDNHHSVKLINSVLYNKFSYSHSYELKGSVMYTYTFGYSVPVKKVAQ